MKTEQEFENYVAELGRKGIAKRKKRIAVISSATGTLACCLVVAVSVILIGRNGLNANASGTANANHSAYDVDVNQEENVINGNVQANADSSGTCTVSVSDEDMEVVLNWLVELVSTCDSITESSSDATQADVIYTLKRGDEVYTICGNVLTYDEENYILTDEDMSFWHEFLEEHDL